MRARMGLRRVRARRAAEGPSGHWQTSASGEGVDHHLDAAFKQRAPCWRGRGGSTAVPGFTPGWG